MCCQNQSGTYFSTVGPQTLKPKLLIAVTNEFKGSFVVGLCEVNIFCSYSTELQQLALSWQFNWKQQGRSKLPHSIPFFKKMWLMRKCESCLIEMAQSFLVLRNWERQFLLCSELFKVDQNRVKAKCSFEASSFIVCAPRSTLPTPCVMCLDFEGTVNITILVTFKNYLYYPCMLFYFAF